MDDELKAMSALAEALAGLQQEQKDRVLEWGLAKFGSGAVSRGGVYGIFQGAKVQQDEGWGTFGELFHAGDPMADKEKALLAAYWVQIVGGADSFASQTLNTLLKDLGYGVSNITAALSQLQEERPALIIQLRKSGTSQQARKIYKLTDAGRRRSQEMLSQSGKGNG